MTKQRIIKTLYQVSKVPVLGWPLRLGARLRSTGSLSPLHLRPDNVTHNRAQLQTLARFEASITKDRRHP